MKISLDPITHSLSLTSPVSAMSGRDQAILLRHLLEHAGIIMALHHADCDKAMTIINKGLTKLWEGK